MARRRFSQKPNEPIWFFCFTVRKYLKLEIEISSFKYFRTVMAKTKQISLFVFGENLWRAICFRFYLTFSWATLAEVWAIRQFLHHLVGVFICCHTTQINDKECLYYIGIVSNINYNFFTAFCLLNESVCSLVTMGWNWFWRSILFWYFFYAFAISQFFYICFVILELFHLIHFFFCFTAISFNTIFPVRKWKLECSFKIYYTPLYCGDM